MGEHENKSPGINRQMQIYMNRRQDGAVPFPISYAELTHAARQELTDDAFGYLLGGAADGQVLSANEAAFDAWHLVPRVLGDVNS
ncbi:MAG: hypothetical protein HKN84_01550, partial [Gammaproteobacteria bacterium]|nr:hypothetical protein [Gammaproteobacteria bacterium]